jgi:hypothetical protein
MNADEVIPERIERDHVRVIFKLLAECVRQPSEPPHRHSHREVRPLGIRRADVLRVATVSPLLEVDPDRETAGAAS